MINAEKVERKTVKIEGKKVKKKVREENFTTNSNSETKKQHEEIVKTVTIPKETLE